MNKKRVGFWFQVPAIALLVISAVASLVVKITNSYPLTWLTPITLLAITILYFLGRSYEKSDHFSF
ncbi:Uncharacterised protein [uncultured archaeon]|nr:Uncharacterised protein [uncultured archaeon]